MGDAISHAVLPGVAISYMFGINFFFGAVFSGVLTAIGIGFVTKTVELKTILRLESCLQPLLL